MNNQEFERKMNFIVEQQAQFERRHQIWKIEIEDLLTRLARVTNEGFKDVNSKINALVDSHIRMEERQNKTDEQLRLTGEQLRLTDEQLRLTAEQLRINAEQQQKTDEQLRRTDELLRRHLGGRRNGENKS